MNRIFLLMTLLLLANFGLAQTPDLKLKWDCQTCHSATGWSPLASPLKFDHAHETAFPLEGAHRRNACVQCHLGRDIKSLHDFERAPLECSGCHVDYHQGRYGVNCEKCHRSDSWDVGYWNDRHMETLFPLVGSHRGLECVDCHQSGNYFRSTDCSDCHAQAFIDADDPDLHQGLTSTSDCSTCHGPTKWDDHIALGHDKFFNISFGEHAGIACKVCHPNSYQDTDCRECHDSKDGPEDGD